MAPRAALDIHGRHARARPNSSATMDNSMTPNPPPPCCSGRLRPTTPSSEPRARQASRSTDPASAIWRTCSGVQTRSHQLRTSERRSPCSSVNSNSLIWARWSSLALIRV
ncbi:Uncharacterised protein [Mycobacteroides abscessus subsp. abscessus]|nr:Uncharacterised protein [Mycobacteroides abscessus subsp. abscessus]